MPLKSVECMNGGRRFATPTIFSKRKNFYFVQPKFIDKIVQDIVFHAEKRVEERLVAKEMFKEVLEKAEKNIENKETIKKIVKEIGCGCGGEGQDLDLLKFTVKNLGRALSEMVNEIKQIKKRGQDAENYILFVEKKLNESNAKVRQLEGCLSSDANELRACANDIVTLKATNTALLSRIKFLERT